MWFRLIAHDSYFQHYAPCLRLIDGKFQPIWWAALLIYVLFSLSLLMFVIPLAQNALLPAALYGALLGVTLYGVYNLTCIAVFKDLPIASTFTDICWGGFSYGMTAFLIQWFNLH